MLWAPSGQGGRVTGFPLFFLLAVWETPHPTIQTLLTWGFVFFFPFPQSQLAKEDRAHGGVSMEVWSLVTNL